MGMKLRTRVVRRLASHYLKRLVEDPEIIELARRGQIGYPEVMKQAILQAACDYDGVKELENSVAAEMAGKDVPVALHAIEAKGSA